jgi:hypothetical protein
VKQQSKKGGDMARGINLSILAMLGMLVLVGGGVATMIYKVAKPTAPTES